MEEEQKNKARYSSNGRIFLVEAKQKALAMSLANFRRSMGLSSQSQTTASYHFGFLICWYILLDAVVVREGTLEGWTIVWASNGMVGFEDLGERGPT